MSLPENEHWVVFPMDEDEPDVVMTDLALADDAPHASLPVALCLRVPFQDPGDLGIGDDDEYDAICAEEDAAVKRIKDELGGVRAGRIRMEGQLDVWFYVPQGTEESAAAILGEALGERDHEVGVAEDPEWNVFQENLLPDTGQMQWTLDQELVSTFEDMGDDLSVERPVRFYSYFETQDAADAFSNEARSAGFTAELSPIDMDEDADEQDPRPCVMVTCTTAIDFDTVHPVTMQVLQMAEGHGGDFDGWEAQPASALGS